MRYNEIKCDLFSLGPEYYLAHCISADFALGAGIAVQFNRRFDLHKKLKAEYPRYAHVEQMWLTHYSPGLVDPEKYISNATNIFKRTMCAYDTLSTVLEYQ